jgi:hypothetical protein
MGIRITDLASATTVGLTDTLVLVQGGNTKKCEVSQVKTLNASEIVSGTLGVARLPVVPVSLGGTGSVDATSAVAALGAQPALTSSAPASIVQGGTGATTAVAALNALGGITSAVVPSLVTTQLSAYTLLSQSAAFQNSAQVRALASAQIAAITPASIGALATSAASGFATTAQVVGIANTAQLAAFQNSAQVQALTTAQLNAITLTAGSGLTGGGTLAQSRTIALQTSGVAANIYGSNSTVPVIDVDSFGRITGATTQTITPASIGAVATNQLSGYATTTQIAGIAVTSQLTAFQNSAQVQALTTSQLDAITLTAGSGLTGGGTLSANRTIALQTTGVSAGTFGTSTSVAQFTVNDKGQITSATNVGISGSAGGTVVAVGASSSTLAISNSPVTYSGALQLELATTGVAAITAGSSTQSAVITVDAYGRVTALQTQAIAIAASQVLAGLTSAQISGIASSALPASGVTPGSYGSSAQIAALTVDETGRITGVSNIAASGGGGGAGTGMEYAVVQHNTQVVPASAGTVNLSAWANGATTINFSATPAFTLVPGMVINATGLNTIAIKTINSPTQVVLATGATAAGSATNNVTVQNSNTTTLTVTAGALPTYDGRTIQLNDVVYLTGQGTTTPTAQNGPWTVTTLGATGVSAVFTRPSWFTGTIGGPRQVGIRGGTNNYGYTFSIAGNIASSTSYTVGVDPLLSVNISSRATLATLSGTSPFTAKQTFAANSTTVNPFSFSSTAGQALLTTATLGAVEWDNQQMYVTSSTPAAGLTRNPVATAMVPINNQTASYTFVLADAGKMIVVNSASAATLTVPLDSTTNFSIGTQILVTQIGAGQVNVSGTSGVTVIGKNGINTSGPYAIISLIKIAANNWIVAGDATI